MKTCTAWSNSNETICSLSMLARFTRRRPGYLDALTECHSWSILFSDLFRSTRDYQVDCKQGLGPP